MKLLAAAIAVLSLFLAQHALGASQQRFGETLCSSEDYFCIKVKSGETWEMLFPNIEERDIVKRINRMNIGLRKGMTIAVPKNIDRLTVYDVSPFPRYIESDGEKTIFVSQKQLAWGAYDEQGELVWWGPLSSGSGTCRNIEGNCKTPSGSFRVIRKQDISCISTTFPMRADGNNGGAEMPYCMHFFRGYALHGSDTVPGYRASHGCVRMFVEDARWLNEEFVEVPEDGVRGTRVIVESVEG
ncbi:L,D-transpeptidase [Legionella septentrionalis]|uniref:L,D-transpeptidase n=1 Tax=Legionella septentrionalis TaxID=2498109 RepID=UPI000F8DC81B|nr:L,D-transpeptidase [Legionella septentrionalis]RUR08837.1 L,D-transpeptidase [Legionella septentrionalis]